MAGPGQTCYTAAMSKPMLRALLTAAALILALNLLLFTYARFVILPLLGALFLLALCVGLGDALAARLRVAGAGVPVKAGLGLTAVTAIFFLLGTLRLLSTPFILAFFAAALAVFARRFLVGGEAGGNRRRALEFFSRPVAEYAVFLLPLVYASLPPTFYDSLVYHLGIPNLYLQWGGFVPTPHFVFANTFIYYEISLIPAVFLGDLVPRLFHFLLGTLFMLFVADEAVSAWGAKRRLAVLLAAVSMPMSLFLLATCKNDLIGAWFIFLAISRFRRGDWKLAAVFWGFAVGVKSFNLLPLALFALVAFRPWKPGELRRLLLTGAIVILVLSPLLAKNWLLAGNPVFPFLPKAFPTEHWDAGRFRIMQEDVGAVARAPADLLRLPYDLSFFNHGYGGLAGPLALIFLPFLLLGPVRGKRWLAWALMLLACAPWLTASMRFVHAAFVVLAVFAAIACESAAAKLLRAVFFLVVLLNFSLGFAMLEKFYQGHTAWGGTLAPDEYRERFFPAFPAFAYLNRRVPANARILLLGEARSYYLRVRCQLSSAIDHGIAGKYLRDSRDAREFLAAVRRDGFTHLLVNFSELKRLSKRYRALGEEEEARLHSFLGELTPLFRSGALAVYRCD